MEYHVVVMKITAGHMDDFVSEWTSQEARIRRRRGFTIIGAWTLEETNEFVWIMGYDGDEGFAAANAAYHASEERQALDPDPGRFVESTSDHMGRRIV